MKIHRLFFFSFQFDKLLELCRFVFKLFNSKQKEKLINYTYIKSHINVLKRSKFLSQNETRPVKFNLFVLKKN